MLSGHPQAGRAPLQAPLPKSRPWDDGPEARAAIGTRRLVLCVGAGPAAEAWRELDGPRWRCHRVADVDSALQAASALHFDALLLAEGALGDDWVQSLATLRAAGSGPLLVLADPGDEFDEILALELGADDYLVPPFHTRRLRARLAAAVRAPSQRQPTPAPLHTPTQTLPHEPADLPLHIVRDGWSLDLTQGLLRGHGHELRLSLAPAHVLGLLLERAGSVLTRAEISRHFGRTDAARYGRSADMRMHQLRRRLAQAGVGGLTIDTVHRIGYALRLQPSSHPQRAAAAGAAEQAPPRLAAVS